MYNKIDLYTIHQQHRQLNMFIWDAWFQWRLKQAGISDFEETRWKKMLYSMPEIFEWHPELDGTIRVCWDGGEECIPMEDVVDDMDDQPDLELLWHCNYWDGPLSGMARYNGEMVWFECINEEDYGDRQFGLYSLSTEDKAELYRQHELFREMVGHHCDHHPDRYAPFVCRDKEKFEAFYETKLPKVDATKGQKLAEVHWFQFKYWGRPRKQPVDPERE